MKTITLANLDTSTAQEVFDHVVAHARKQKVKSGQMIDGTFVCAYRDKQNNACFAGCLMTDEEYKEYEVGEGSNWKHMIDNLAKKGITTKHSKMIESLQTTHDWRETTIWEESFSVHAGYYGLVYTAPLEIES